MQNLFSCTLKPVPWHSRWWKWAHLYDVVKTGQDQNPALMLLALCIFFLERNDMHASGTVNTLRLETCLHMLCCQGHWSDGRSRKHCTGLAERNDEGCPKGLCVENIYDVKIFFVGAAISVRKGGVCGVLTSRKLVQHVVFHHGMHNNWLWVVEFHYRYPSTQAAFQQLQAM